VGGRTSTGDFFNRNATGDVKFAGAFVSTKVGGK